MGLSYGLLRRERNIFLIGMWTLASFIGLWVLKHMFNYHHVPLIPPLSVLAGCGLGYMISARFRRLDLSILKYAFMIFIFLWSAVIFCLAEAPHYSRWFSYIRGDLSKRDYLGEYVSGGEFSYYPAHVTARYVAGRTDEEDCIFVWGYQPAVYFLSDRKNASRFIFNYPFLTYILGEMIPSSYAPMRGGMRKTLVRELESSEPKYIIISTWESNPKASLDWVEFERFENLRNFVFNRYLFEKKIGRYFIYRQNEEINDHSL
ncbi:MAG: hypothetical protein QMD08_06950 [Actinomycetota bacterium]|nr:hypothetical protein [Actinomycetota bacterium]